MRPCPCPCLLVDSLTRLSPFPSTHVLCDRRAHAGWRSILEDSRGVYSRQHHQVPPHPRRGARAAIGIAAQSPLSHSLSLQHCLIRALAPTLSLSLSITPIDRDSQSLFRRLSLSLPLGEMFLPPCARGCTCRLPLTRAPTGRAEPRSTQFSADSVAL
jgi:hypothetical protein